MKPDEDAFEFEVGALVSPTPSRHRPIVAGEPPVPDDLSSPSSSGENPRGEGGRRRKRAVAWAISIAVVAGLLGAVAYVVDTRAGAQALQPRFSDLSAPPTLAKSVDVDDLGAPLSPAGPYERRPSVSYLDGKLVATFTNGRLLTGGTYSNESSMSTYQYTKDDGTVEHWRLETTALRVVRADDLTASWSDEWPYESKMACFSDTGLIAIEPTDDGADLTLRSWSDGRELSRRRLGDGVATSITANSKVVVVTQPVGSQACLATAYDLPDLSERWGIQVDQPCAVRVGLRNYAGPTAELISVPMEHQLLVDWTTGEIVHDAPDTWAMPMASGQFFVNDGANSASGVGTLTVHAADGRPLFAIEDGGWIVTDEADPSAPLVALVAGEDDPGWGPRNWDVKAADPTTGSVLWTLPGVGQLLGVTHGVLLTVDESFTLRAFDTADGRQLWQARSSYGENVAFLGSDSSAALVVNTRYDEDESTSVLVAFDLTLGTELWRHELPPNSQVVSSLERDVLYTVDNDALYAWRLLGS